MKRIFRVYLRHGEETAHVDVRAAINTDDEALRRLAVDQYKRVHGSAHALGRGWKLVRADLIR